MNIYTFNRYYATGKIIFLFLFAAILSFSCDKKNNTMNIFSIQDDIKFGREFDNQIYASGEYIIASESQYPEAYARINCYKDRLLATGEVVYTDKFEWKVRIIKDDATVNAFSVPGGYLYFYTGLIRMMDNEAEFVGVMAHEMGHVACRHSTKQLTKVYGVDLLLSILLGKNENEWVKIVSDVGSGLLALQFSRTDEYEADKCAVKYTYPTDWDARGVGDFLSKLESQSSLVFLSTHPTDAQRITKINEEWRKLGGKQGEYFKTSYDTLKSVLP